MSRVLVMGTDERLRANLAEYLRLELLEVKELPQLRGATDAVRRIQPDLVIVDNDGLSTAGLALARDLRDVSRAPLIMISDRNSESDRITALEFGADEYLAKPVSAKEVVLHAMALLRLSHAQEEKRVEEWVLGDRRLRLEPASHRTFVDAERVMLTAAEWKILGCLVGEEGAVVSRDRVMERCFASSAEVYNRVVDTHVKNLRAKLRSPKWIETVKGFGYRFAGEHPEAARLRDT